MPIPFEADQKSYEELMRGDGKFAYAIPLYQRRYVWKIEQNQRLWDDILSCFENQSNHFTGSLVLMGYKKDDYDQPYQADKLAGKGFNVKHVVDGQQRLTSVSLVLAALYSDMREQEGYFKQAGNGDDQCDQDWNSLQSKMRECLVTDIRDSESKSQKGYIPKIIPVKSVYESYKSIVNNESEGIGKKLLLEKAYAFHRQNIADLRERLFRSDAAFCDALDFYGFYQDMYGAITGWLKFVRIDCADGEDPFQVFESLNGTGLSLTSADRIKNVLMGKGSRDNPPMRMSEIEQKWKELEALVGEGGNMESFISAYLFICARERVSRKNLCNVFVEKYLCEFGSVGEALNDLHHAAQCYSTITRCMPYVDKDGKRKELSQGTKRTLEGIMSNNPHQSIVPLLAMALEHGFDSGFDLISKRLLHLLIRHKVCQRSTNMLDRYFEKFCDSVKSKTPAELDELLRNNQAPDTTFMASFASMTFDHSVASDGKRARYYLMCIENHIRNNDGEDNLDPTESYTLEHIIPQAFKPEDWFESQPNVLEKIMDDDPMFREDIEDSVIPSIGNMCILRRAENSRASNKNFSGKISSYRKFKDDTGKTAYGTFRLVRQICDNSMEWHGKSSTLVQEGGTFDAESVKHRAEILARYAAEIWD